MEKCICIKCDRSMNNIAHALGGKGLQPVHGLAFSTRGHYGSGFFDPMDGRYIEVAICDECVESAVEGGLAYQSTGSEDT